MSYRPRIVDREVARALEVAGAIVLKGPRACGKTSTAKQFAASAIHLDRDTPETVVAREIPAVALEGAQPRLLDEWQEVPGVWNEVRHRVDDSDGPGLFILTGSASPADDVRRHSGAGRMRSIVMRTMTLAERGVDAESVSLSAIVDGRAEPNAGTGMTLREYADVMVGGGWPGFLDLGSEDAAEGVDSYLDEIAEHDFPQVASYRRDPRRLMTFLRGYAGLIAQPATGATIRKRMGDLTSGLPAAETIASLHDFASRLYLIEDQPAWSASMRSKTALVQMPKRHLADVSLAASLLGASADRLLADPETLGIFFESLMVHDLRVYAQDMRARGVYHLRDMKARDELDAVLELRDGRWVGIEAKLSHHAVDEAAANLVRVSAKVERAPSALLVIVPTGPAYQRPDGVWVVPLASLRP